MAVSLDAASSDLCALLGHMTNAKYWLHFPSNHKTTGVTGGAFIMEASGGRSRRRGRSRSRGMSRRRGTAGIEVVAGAEVGAG